MLALGIRVLALVVVVYIAVLGLLYVFQSRFLYPAPQDIHLPAPGFEAVELQTADGLALDAHWLPPEADQPGVVFFHGNAGSLAGATEETKLLSTQGYGVLLVSYRGYGGNPGDPSEEGFYNDGRAAMAFLKQNGIAPATTIVIGNSIGSGTATQMALEFEPAALILISPFDSLIDVAAETMPIIPVRMLIRDRFDNVAKIGELSMPILIQHGTVDKVVPYAHAVRLADHAPKAELQPFEGEGHDLSFQTRAQIEQSEWLASLGF